MKNLYLKTSKGHFQKSSNKLIAVFGWFKTCIWWNFGQNRFSGLGVRAGSRQTDIFSKSLFLCLGYSPKRIIPTNFWRSRPQNDCWLITDGASLSVLIPLWRTFRVNDNRKRKHGCLLLCLFADRGRETLNALITV